MRWPSFANLSGNGDGLLLPTYQVMGDALTLSSCDRILATPSHKMLPRFLSPSTQACSHPPSFQSVQLRRRSKADTEPTILVNNPQPQVIIHLGSQPDSVHFSTITQVTHDNWKPHADSQTVCSQELRISRK